MRALRVSLVQLAALEACRLNPKFRETEGWLAQVWASGEQRYRDILLHSLNSLLESFQRRDLVQLPEHVELPLTRLEQLHGFPSLTRAGLRSMYPVLKELYHGRKRYAHYHTGGTSGQPTQLYRPKSHSAAELASTCQMLRVVGWRPGMLRIALWGSQQDLNLGVGPRWSVRRSINRALQQVQFFATYKSDEAVYRRFIDCVLHNRGAAIYGYPTMLVECARLLDSMGVEIPAGQVAAIWTTAEMLTPGLRDEIMQCYKVRPGDFYGTRECPAIAAECEFGVRHINPRYIVEALGWTDSAPLGEGETGELAVTDLLNYVTPLVRYRIGDRGSASWRTCGCGRSGLTLDAFEGRVADSYVLKSGGRRTAIWFTDIVRYPEVSRAQLVRLGIDSFEVRYTGSQLPDASVSRMKEVAGYMLEGAEIAVRLVDRLPRTENGKYQVYIDESCSLVHSQVSGDDQ